MIDQIETIARAAGHAIELIASDAASLNPWWLVAGIVVLNVTDSLVYPLAFGVNVLVSPAAVVAPMNA